MNKRKLVSAVSVIMSVMTATAFANSIVLSEPQINGDNISITGTTPMGQEEIIVTVTKKGESISNKKAVYFSKQTTSDTDGDFSFNFTMSTVDRMTGEGFMGGEFTIYARSTNSELVTDDFVFVSVSSKGIALDYINERRTDKTKLFEFLNDSANKLVLESIGTPIDKFLALSNDMKLEVCRILSDNESDFDEALWKELSNDAVLAMEVNGITDISGVEAFLQNDEIKEKLTLEHEGIKYSDASEKIKSIFHNMVLSASSEDKFESVTELDTKYAQAVVLDKINNANYALIFDEIIKPNKDVLGLSLNSSYTYIQSLSSDAADGVMRFLKQNSEVFSDTDVFISTLEAAISKYKASLTIVQGSASGGGSGSKGDSNFSIIQNPGVTVTDKKEDKITDNTEDKVYFSDTSSVAWAEEAINTLAGAGVVSGVGDGKFEPARQVTRAEYLKMLILALDLLDDSAMCDFDDVSRSDWFYPYVATAQSLGITNGISENLFGSNELITREQMAVFAHRAANRAFLPVISTVSNEIFADDDNISEWAKRSVYLMRGSKIISGMGDNSFMPRANATRAEAVKIIYELYKLG